jgi:hypothetical protein
MGLLVVLLFMTGGALLQGASPAGAASWTQVGDACANGGVAGSSTYVFCWAKKKESGDADPLKDFFQIRYTIVGASTNGDYMGKLWVEPYPLPGSTAQSFQGADPMEPTTTRTFNTGDCKEYTVGITGGVPAVASGSFSYTWTQCKKETTGPKSYSDQGHWAGIWSASPRIPSGTYRKIAAMMNVKVAQGQTANWKTDRKGANVYGSAS